MPSQFSSVDGPQSGERTGQLEWAGEGKPSQCTPIDPATKSSIGFPPFRRKRGRKGHGAAVSAGWIDHLALYGPFCPQGHDSESPLL